MDQSGVGRQSGVGSGVKETLGRGWEFVGRTGRGGWVKIRSYSHQTDKRRGRTDTRIMTYPPYIKTNYC